MASLGVSIAAPPPIFEAQLFRVKQATAISRADFGLSGKVTELSPDLADPKIRHTFRLPLTEVWAQSEELIVAEQPLNYPLYGRFLDLKELRPDLVSAQVVAVSGKRQKVAVAERVTTLSFFPEDGSDAKKLHPGDVLTLTTPARRSRSTRTFPSPIGAPSAAP